MAKVTVVGSINMDLVVRVPRFPIAGETILGGVFQTIPGGKGANQAVAARRLGAEVAMIGRVGDDAFGSVLRQTLVQEGISTERLTVAAVQATGVALITVEDSGENTIIVVPGANGQITTADIDAAHSLIAGADILLMQLEIPLQVAEYAAELAHAGGVTLILNAAPAQPLPPALLAQVDYLVVNEVEASLLAGTVAAHPADAARALQALGAQAVVVTLGAEGSLLVSRDGTSVSAPQFTVRAVDTTAAGDAFAGAFAVALASGMPPDQALRWGNAAGALAVTRAGAQPSLPARLEVDEFLKNHVEASQCRNAVFCTTSFPTWSPAWGTQIHWSLRMRAYPCRPVCSASTWRSAAEFPRSCRFCARSWKTWPSNR
jgi:ribokinase